jgi:hypothetical protein
MHKPLVLVSDKFPKGIDFFILEQRRTKWPPMILVNLDIRKFFVRTLSERAKEYIQNEPGFSGFV